MLALDIADLGFHGMSGDPFTIVWIMETESKTRKKKKEETHICTTACIVEHQVTETFEEIWNR